MIKITNKEPYFDKEGNFYIPNDIKFGGETIPKLKPKEWFFLLLTMADKTQITNEKQSIIFKDLIGSKSNSYKIKKSLKEKGYL